MCVCVFPIQCAELTFSSIRFHKDGSFPGRRESSCALRTSHAENGLGPAPRAFSDCGSQLNGSNPGLPTLLAQSHPPECSPDPVLFSDLTELGSSSAPSLLQPLLLRHQGCSHQAVCVCEAAVAPASSSPHQHHWPPD